MDKAKAIAAFGTIRHLAAATGLTYEAVRQWPEIIPEPRASQVREAIRAKAAQLLEMVK
jgi:hypothetical protein